MFSNVYANIGKKNRAIRSYFIEVLCGLTSEAKGIVREALQGVDDVFGFGVRGGTVFELASSPELAGTLDKEVFAGFVRE